MNEAMSPAGFRGDPEGLRNAPKDPSTTIPASPVQKMGSLARGRSKNFGLPSGSGVAVASVGIGPG